MKTYKNTSISVGNIKVMAVSWLHKKLWLAALFTCPAKDTAKDTVHGFDISVFTVSQHVFRTSKSPHVDTLDSARSGVSTVTWAPNGPLI